ncbi:universal stress protein [Actinoplanes sp. NPDC024001]|uniref:universal stress protein n=1 Tax=Actinoplanes sp. NPDC024001 TaxID=3154598 RepID=UPI0033DCD1E0
MQTIASVTEKLSVVVGVDDLPTALHSVDIAADEAVRLSVPLVIVHAWPGWHRGTRYRAVAADRKDGRHLLDLAVQRAEHAHPGLPVRAELTDDSGAKALLERSGQASLLVIGHRDTAGRRLGWGPTATYLAHHSSCPLLVHQGPATSRGPVVLAASGRHTATMELAYDFAARTTSPLVAVHVWTAGHPGQARDSGRGAAERRLADVLAVGGARWPDVEVERLLINENDIAYTVQRAMRRSRLLVAGVGHKGWTIEVARRSTFADVGTRQACAVLLVPPGWPSGLLAQAASANTARC